jgi:large subunit ribosomal protein L21
MSSVMIVSGEVVVGMEGDVKISGAQKVLRIIGRPAHKPSHCRWMVAKCVLGLADFVRNGIIFGSAEIRLQNSYQEVNMYAVIKTGGKQYRVASGEKIKVEQIAADVGQEIVIDQVLAVGNGAELKVGTPLVSGATVKATVVAHGKHDKVHIFKMRRRKHYQKRQGHRQQFTELQIGVIAA